MSHGKDYRVLKHPITTTLPSCALWTSRNIPVRVSEGDKIIDNRAKPAAIIVCSSTKIEKQTKNRNETGSDLSLGVKTSKPQALL